MDSRNGGMLNLVDLAGSERQSKTGSTVSTSLLSDVMKMSGCKRASCIFHYVIIISFLGVPDGIYYTNKKNFDSLNQPAT